MEISGGRVWILPIGADDVQVVTADVASYELAGELHLAGSVGTLDSVQMGPDHDALPTTRDGG